MPLESCLTQPGVTIAVGGVAVRFLTSDAAFAAMLRERYGSFVNDAAPLHAALAVDLHPPGELDPDHDVDVRREGDDWLISRGDFHARWNPQTRRGTVRQTANPYSADTVLRILHSLELARTGEGILLHGASAVRNGRAFLFSGVSGAGKTTLSRLAPPDAQVLTDEISLIRRVGGEFRAFGTPFAGELARVGENVSAPVARILLLAQAPENRFEPLPTGDAVRLLMRNVLFFAQDPVLVANLLNFVCDMATAIPPQTFHFRPEPGAWDLIR